jgi:hypothetical protein
MKTFLALKNFYKAHKNIFGHILIFIFFFVITFFYCKPVFHRQEFNRDDISWNKSVQSEIKKYEDKGQSILWTNQMFGGMPTYQIWAPYSNNIATHIITSSKKLIPAPVDVFLWLLIGAYLLFCVMETGKWLAIIGAIAFTFSTYNILSISTGHSNLVEAVAFFAPTIGGVMLTMRGRFLKGFIITSFFLSLEIRANHIQMTYYLLLLLSILYAVECIFAVKKGNFGTLLKPSLVLLSSILLAVAINASLLWTTYEYGLLSYRGPSNLRATNSLPKDGLNRNYAYEFSEGVGETITFLIPDFYGRNMSGPSDSESMIVKSLTQDGFSSSAALKTAGSNFPLYWGRKKFTAGPFYFGSIICFFCCLGIVIVRRKEKYWLIGVIVLGILLSFGENWPYLSDIFFYHVPFYNKFRVVEAILSIVALAFVILTIMAVQELINYNDRKNFKKIITIILILFSIFFLMLFTFPKYFFSFKAEHHDATAQEISLKLNISLNKANLLGKCLIEDRISLARKDIVRSYLFIFGAYLTTILFITKKIKNLPFFIILLSLVLSDLWLVDKRFLSYKAFEPESVHQGFSQRKVDEQINRDRDPNYRVFDVTANMTFDYFNPAFHKSISGYSAARLKRIDEIIIHNLTDTVNVEVLNMLNVKYFITIDSLNKLIVIKNANARGNAWFVEHIRLVNGPDQEMTELGHFNSATDIILDKQHAKFIQKRVKASNANIDLTSYNPDHLVYQSTSQTTGIAVFSEIFYDKGWKMFIDGVEHPYFRADYLLRAAEIPSGRHKIEFVFHPKSYYFGEKISLAGSTVLLLSLLLGCYDVKRNKRLASS